MKAKVVNCKKLGIREHPWLPEEEPEIAITIPAGEVVTVLSLKEIYDWTGKKFYRVQTESGIEGFAIVEALEIL